MVATVRALKNHGGVAKDALNEENLEALEAGLPNLLQHVENITQVFNLPCVVAINRFPTDTEAELKLVEDKCRELGVNVALSEVWAKGGEGGLALADEVVRLCNEGDEAGRGADTFQFAYDGDLNLREKIEAIATRVYRADGVDFDAKAAKELAKLEKLGFGRHARVHGEDPVQLQRRPEEAWRAARVPHHGARRQGERRRRVRGCSHGQHHDDAGPGQIACRLQDRRRRDRKDHGAVLKKTRFGSSALVQWCASARGSRCMLETMVGYRTLIALSV